MNTIRTKWGEYAPIIGKSLMVLILLGAVSYTVLFTSLGNTLLKPWIQDAISEALETPVEIDTFELDHQSLLIRFHDSARNECTVGTSFSLLTWHGNGYYRVDLSRPLAGMNRFNTPFKLIGSLSGGYHSLSILGSMQLDDGAIPYTFHLADFSLDTLSVYLSNVDYGALAALFEIPSDTLTRVNGHIHLKGFRHRSLEGSILLKSQTDRFSPVPLEDEDNTSFDLAEWLADENGYIKRFDVNITAHIDLSESGILDPVLGIRTKGPIEMDGRLSGNHLQTRLDLSTTLARSTSSARVDFVHLVPHAIRYDIVNADLGHLFRFLDLNPPILGSLSSQGELTASDGHLVLRVVNGRTVPNVLKNEYAITQPPMLFNADLKAKITPQSVHYQGRFESNLKRMEIDTQSTHPMMFQDLLKILP